MVLYDDENAKIESGPVKDKQESESTYHRAKENQEKIDKMMAERASEASVRLSAWSITQSCNSLLQTYPNHKELQAWKEKAEEILAKIGDREIVEEVTEFLGVRGNTLEDLERKMNELVLGAGYNILSFETRIVKDREGRNEFFAFVLATSKRVSP